VTDHRVKLTKGNVQGVLGGDLTEFTAALEDDERRRALAAAAEMQAGAG
jgi:peptide chain release factor 1